MMSLKTIHRMNDEQGDEAALGGKIPYVLFNEDDVHNMPGGKDWERGGHRKFPFPNLGSYVPEGWEVTEEIFFVDSTGVGADDKPALTIKQFNAELLKLVKRWNWDRESIKNPTIGLAISEEGQFQLYVSVYKKVT